MIIYTTYVYSSAAYYHSVTGHGITLTSINPAYYSSTGNNIRLKTRLVIGCFPCSIIIHIYMTLLDAFFTPSCSCDLAQAQSQGDFLNTRVLSPHETVHRPKLVWFDALYSSIYKINYKYSRLTKLQSKVRLDFDNRYSSLMSSPASVRDVFFGLHTSIFSDFACMPKY